MATRVVTYGTVVWAIDSFAPESRNGWDIPGPVARGTGVLVPYLFKIFHACLAIFQPYGTRLR